MKVDFFRGSFRESKIVSTEASVKDFTEDEISFHGSLYGRQFASTEAFILDKIWFYESFHGNFHGSFRGSKLLPRKLSWK